MENMNKIHIHNIAADFVEHFEDILIANKVLIPSPEDRENKRDKDDYGLYGSNLLKNGMLEEIDGLKNSITQALNQVIPVSKKEHCYVTYEFETEVI